jgi:hypothetical protein
LGREEIAPSNSTTTDVLAGLRQGLEGQLFSFPDRLDTTPSAPILSLFGLLVEAIGAQDLKPTAVKDDHPSKNFS